jgi:hypothetical protein
MATDHDPLHTAPATFAGHPGTVTDLLERFRAADRELGLAITMGNARDAVMHARAIQVYAAALVAPLAERSRHRPATLPRTTRRNKQRRNREGRSADAAGTPLAVDVRAAQHFSEAEGVGRAVSYSLCSHLLGA